MKKASRSCGAKCVFNLACLCHKHIIRLCWYHSHSPISVYKWQVHIFFIQLFTSFFGQYFTDSSTANGMSAKQLAMLTVSALFINRQRTHNAGFGSPSKFGKGLASALFKSYSACCRCTEKAVTGCMNSPSYTPVHFKAVWLLVLSFLLPCLPYSQVLGCIPHFPPMSISRCMYLTVATE